MRACVCACVRACVCVCVCSIDGCACDFVGLVVDVFCMPGMEVPGTAGWILAVTMCSIIAVVLSAFCSLLELVLYSKGTQVMTSRTTTTSETVGGEERCSIYGAIYTQRDNLICSFECMCVLQYCVVSFLILLTRY